MAAVRRSSKLLPRSLSAAVTAPLRSFSSLATTDDQRVLTVEASAPFIGHRIDPPSLAVSTTPAELLSFFRVMSRMRRMEMAADSLYKAKLIRGFCHLYDGQEAVAVGMEAVITSYRDHCTFIGRGGTLLEAFGELMGRREGCSKGKGGSMHFYMRGANCYGGHGIVGAQVPLGCGLTFAQKYTKAGSVTFALYGDGAANQGQLFEALNMATLWDLPVILMEWDRRVRATKSPAYYKRGDYVPGLKVDGMDALAVKQACRFAKEHALASEPIILEMDTYRYHGHSISDPGSTYRSRDEITGVRQEQDPIERIRKLILSHELASATELKDIEKEVRKEVDEAIARAKECPMPDPSELFTNVFVKGYGVEAFGQEGAETFKCTIYHTKVQTESFHLCNSMAVGNLTVRTEFSKS